jgi:glycosyltransferase involved in cell wall biosynthesis
MSTDLPSRVRPPGGNTADLIQRDTAGGIDSVRVIQFLRPPVAGGFSVERIYENVRRGLPKDIEVEVVVSRHPNTGFLPRLRGAIDAWRERGQVNHVLGDTQYLAWFLPRRRTILTVLDCVSLERLKGWRLWLLWLLGYWWPLRRSGQVVVISDFTRRHLQSWVSYPDERITIIPPSLSPDFTYSAPRPHKEWSRLLHIGMMPNKNLPRVIEAIAGLDVTLVIIGKLSEEYLGLLEKHGTRYENHYDLDGPAVIEQYRQADVLVFASTYEGFGMPIVEAQAIGRPVVTSNVASMPEAAGGAACLVDPYDVSSIRAGICRVLEDESYAAELIETGRENARAYELGHIGQQFAELYRRVAAEAELGR